MSLNNRLIAELKQESATTRNLLAAVPMEKGDFKPHEKSMTLRRLATHVAEIAGWWQQCLVEDVLDFQAGNFVPTVINSTDDLLALHDSSLVKSLQVLADTPESEFENQWTMRSGEQIYFTLPKSDVTRTWCLNHLYHHRGQLTVYLRLLDVPLPGTYGPSADTM